VAEAAVEGAAPTPFPIGLNPLEVEEDVKHVDLVVKELARQIREVQARSEALIKISGFIGLWKASTCRYYDEKRGVCRAWRLREDAADEVRKLLGPDAVWRDEKGFERFRIARYPFICAICPLYRSRASEEKGGEGKG